MSFGVLYYNKGTSCAVRLLVSLHSLRRHYAGPVTILSDGDDSHALCSLIGKDVGADIQPWAPNIPEGRHTTYLAKTIYHTATPYETTVCLDSDTLVVGCIDQVFDVANRASFAVAQLGSWRSDGGTIRKRILQWRKWLPEYIEAALRFGPAINCGVVAFRRDASLLRDWLRLALPGRDTFIPDEVCCQVILHRYSHEILNNRWNRSCKHDDPNTPDTSIIHYHGRKHCRAGLPFHGMRWCLEFEHIVRRNIAAIKDWMPSGDRMLRRYLRSTDRKQLLNSGGNLKEGWDPRRFDTHAPALTPSRSQARYVVYKYSGSGNLGDAIQTIAIERLIPGKVGYVDRREGESPWADAVWVVNGWLGRNYIPRETVPCLFAGVFVQDSKNFEWLGNSRCPVGARDPITHERLKESGIRSELIGCATMTFERFSGERFGIYAVDVPEDATIPRSAIRLTHRIGRDLPWEEQMSRARHFLELYRRAKMIFTSRLHVALPCLAFGTPVYIIDPKVGQSFDKRAADRFSILAPFGIQYSTPIIGLRTEVEKQADVFRKFLIHHLSTLR